MNKKEIAGLISEIDRFHLAARLYGKLLSQVEVRDYLTSDELYESRNIIWKDSDARTMLSSLHAEILDSLILNYERPSVVTLTSDQVIHRLVDVILDYRLDWVKEWIAKLIRRIK